MPDEDTLARLNATLAIDSRHAEIIRSDTTPTVTDRRTWGTPRALLVPSAQAAAELLAYRDAAGKPLFAVDVAMRGDRHELEDAYQIG